MSNKISLYEVLKLFNTPQGRKLHEDIISDNLPKVLERQEKDGFYTTEDTIEIEEYILDKYTNRLG